MEMETAKTSGSKRKKRFYVRSWTSFVLALSFVAMTLSGLMLYLGPPGGEARMTDWRHWGLGRDGWMAQHMTSCAVFVLFGVIHVCFNARVMWGYVRSRASRRFHRKWELVLAVALAAFMVGGTVYELPPWNYVLKGSRHLQVYRREAERPQHGKGLHGRERGEGRGRGRPPGGRGLHRQRD